MKTLMLIGYRLHVL